MADHWIDRMPTRPDRYLDWEDCNRAARGDTGERWCSVLLQLAAVPGPAPAAELETLRGQIFNQPLSDGTWTIKIHDDELALLDTRILELAQGQYQSSGPDDPGLAFFVYLPEAAIYRNGDFARAPHYRVRFAGPPIPGFRVNQTNADLMLAMAIPESTGPKRRGDVVAVGIIDDGIAFANERFVSRRVGLIDRTRVKHLWLQYVETVDTTPDRHVTFGRRLDGDSGLHPGLSINGAFEASAARTGLVDENAVYAATGAVDYTQTHRQAIAHRAGHGTAVMDVACGFAPGDAAGADRPILAVQLPEPATLDTSGVTMASYVLQGLRQIMLWADKLDGGEPVPLVVNFSYGIYAGPKDGQHVIEREIDRLVAHRNLTTPTAVVLPAGNTYRGRVTAKLSLAPGASQSLDWIILPDGGMPSFLEIWMAKSGDVPPVAVQIVPPAGPAGPPAMPANGTAKVLIEGAKPICAMHFDATANGAGATGAKSRIFVSVSPTKSFDRRQPVAPSGCWRVVVSNTSSATVDIDLFIQREETPAGRTPPGRQSYFDHPHAFERADRWETEFANYDHLGSPGKPCPISYTGTLSALATGSHTVVAGGAMAAMDGAPAKPAWYTSAGPSAARPGPDFAAVSDDGYAFPGILAAGTRSGSIVVLDGTSIAAPQITRRLADAGASVAELRAELGVTPRSPHHPRLGVAVTQAKRTDIPERKRS